MSSLASVVFCRRRCRGSLGGLELLLELSDACILFGGFISCGSQLLGVLFARGRLAVFAGRACRCEALELRFGSRETDSLGLKLFVLRLQVALEGFDQTVFCGKVCLMLGDLDKCAEDPL